MGKKEKIKKKKEKPSYNAWQNSAYVISRAWIRDKSVILVILAQMVLSVAISTIAIFLPKTVVAQITGGTSVRTLVFAVFSFTTATVILQVAKKYLDSIAQLGRINLRMKVSYDILTKAITTDYANLEERKFTDAKQKAYDITGGNSGAAEQIYYSFSRLGTNLLGFLVYIFLLMSVNPLVLIITAATTLFGVWARRLANKWKHNHDSEAAVYSKRLRYINAIGSDHSFAKDIRLFSMAAWLHDIYDSNLRLAFDLSRRVQAKQLFADAVDCVAAFMREGIAYVYLIWQALYNNMPIDNFVLMFAAIGGFSGWIAGILNEYATLLEYSLDYCRLREYLDFPEKFKYHDGEQIVHEDGKTYSFQLNDVSFRYPGAGEDTLEHINLTVEAGEKLAIVGLNGAGKTTLVKLLCGLYDPTEGEVLINGRDIRVYDRRQYYSLFTAVFQEFNILPLSIAENISQQPDENVDDNKITHSLELAGLYEKISSLPEGIDSLLVKNTNEGAVELSGGETQKLMVARALYKDSPILILDEPTAALDPIAENNLYNKYNELSAGKTSVYISHRLASTRFCDRIILIDNKNIAEMGTHDELMEQGGKYTELYNIQSKYYKDVETAEDVVL